MSLSHIHLLAVNGGMHLDQCQVYVYSHAYFPCEHPAVIDTHIIAVVTLHACTDAHEKLVTKTKSSLLLHPAVIDCMHDVNNDKVVHTL